LTGLTGFGLSKVRNEQSETYSICFRMRFMDALY